MNALTNVKNIKKLSEEELKGKNRTSWHEQYRSSAWIFVGGLPFDLTEGDIICVFSQYGELMNINLVRDKESGKSKGFCFICYEDQRSTDLAVDNLNGIKILGRTIRVDHVANYKPPKNNKNKDEQINIISEVHKETLKKANFNVEDGVSKNEVFEEKYELNRHKNKKGKSEKRDFSCKKRSETKNKIKSKHIKSTNLKNLSPSTSSSSSSLSSSSSSSSSVSSSSASSSSTSEEKEEGKIKNKKKDKEQRQKKNRSIEDLKREARLIQAELQRRQQTEESVKKSFESDKKGHPRKKFKSGSNGKDKRHEDSKVKSVEREKERKRNYPESATSRDRGR